jgi:hypothetical protein
VQAVTEVVVLNGGGRPGSPGRCATTTTPLETKVHQRLGGNTNRRFRPARTPWHTFWRDTRLTSAGGYSISRRILPDPTFTTVALLPPGPALNAGCALSVLPAIARKMPLRAAASR